MAKNNTTNNPVAEEQVKDGITTGLQQVQEKKFSVKLRVYLKPYDLKDENGVTKSGTSVTAELIEPFEEYAEDFTNIRVAPRWDRDTAVFKFRMGVYLKTHDDITVSGYCKPVGYESKKAEDKGSMVYYPALFFKLPYSAAEIEFGFKKRKETDSSGKTSYSESGDCYIFRDLVSEKWGGSYEPAISSASEEHTDDIPDGTSLRP